MIVFIVVIIVNDCSSNVILQIEVISLADSNKSSSSSRNGCSSTSGALVSSSGSGSSSSSSSSSRSLYIDEVVDSIHLHAIICIYLFYCKFLN